MLYCQAEDWTSHTLCNPVLVFTGILAPLNSLSVLQDTKACSHAVSHLKHVVNLWAMATYKTANDAVTELFSNETIVANCQDMVWVAQYDIDG